MREPVSVLRACALLVLALAAPAGRGRTRLGTLGPLLHPHHARFPELDLTPPGDGR